MSQSRTEIEEAVKALIGNREVVEMAFKPLAEMLFAHYKALTEAGFTKEQAFQIILQRGME